MTTAAETAAALASPESGMQQGLQTGLRGDDFILRVEANGAVTLQAEDEPVTSFSPGDIKFYEAEGVNFTVMTGATRPENSPRDFEGTHTERDVVWLGKLEYASFGYWAEIEEVDGTYKGNQALGALLDDDEYFVSGNLSRRAVYNDGMGSMTFTGVAAGTAEYDLADQEGFIPLLGTAKLTINNVSNGSLELNFPNFYKFTGAVSTDSVGGGLTGWFHTLDKQGNAFPVDLDTGDLSARNNRISGQLYGPAANNPTEAAGKFSLESDRPGREIEIRGVFGVKK